MSIAPVFAQEGPSQGSIEADIKQVFSNSDCLRPLSDTSDLGNLMLLISAWRDAPLAAVLESAGIGWGIEDEAQLGPEHIVDQSSFFTMAEATVIEVATANPPPNSTVCLLLQYQASADAIDVLEAQAQFRSPYQPWFKLAQQALVNSGCQAGTADGAFGRRSVAAWNLATSIHGEAELGEGSVPEIQTAARLIDKLRIGSCNGHNRGSAFALASAIHPISSAGFSYHDPRDIEHLVATLSGSPAVDKETIERIELLERELFARPTEDDSSRSYLKNRLAWALDVNTLRMAEAYRKVRAGRTEVRGDDEDFPIWDQEEPNSLYYGYEDAFNLVRLADRSAKDQETSDEIIDSSSSGENLGVGIALMEGSSHAGRRVNLALKHFKAAAAQGNRDAEFRFAFAMEHGHGTEPGLSSALQIYRRLAIEGYAAAAFRMATLLEDGVVEIETGETAETYYRMGLAANNPIEIAEGLQQRVVAGSSWLATAEAQTTIAEIVAGRPLLARALADAYLCVDCGGDIDLNAAEKLYLVAARAGDHHSGFRLAMIDRSLFGEETKPRAVINELWARFRRGETTIGQQKIEDYEIAGTSPFFDDGACALY